jgi:branched-chain amino acid transport system ATP-binding protein
MANGQLAPDRGRVLIDGRDVTGLPPRELWRLGVGRTFQITATFASMTVAENVQVALLSRDRAFGVLAKASGYKDEIHALLSEVGMETAAAQSCGALSYGDLKRVDLAMALANAPQLLLMDEPTAGMARRERAQLMDLVARTARDRRTAVLFTEHDMTVVFGHAHRVLVMCRGKIVAEGTPDDIRANRIVREVYLGQSAPAGQ